jgi:hypothetical protein
MNPIEDDYSVLTRFVIVEKYINQKYYTPIFDLQGNVLSFSSIWSGGWGGGMFVSPGIYTREGQIDCIISEKFESDYCELEERTEFNFAIKPEKTLSLQYGYEKYTDTS